MVAGLGALALFLTFSRAAWLGALVLAAVSLALVPRSARPRLGRAIWLGALVMAAAALVLAGLVLTRIGAAGRVNALEDASLLERRLLIGYGLQAWRAQPLTGVGAGGFVQWAARNSGAGFPFEPVHNLPLLVLAETGIIGAAAALALVGTVTWTIGRGRKHLTPAQALWAAALASILVTGLFDHSWWTQPPARMLAVAALAMALSTQPGRPAVQTDEVAPR
jgi:O-antigen ligase